MFVVFVCACMCARARKLSDNLHPHRYPGYVKKVMDKDSGPFIYSSLRLNQRKKPNEGIIQLYYWDYKHLDIKISTKIQHHFFSRRCGKLVKPKLAFRLTSTEFQKKILNDCLTDAHNLIMAKAMSLIFFSLFNVISA